MKISTFWRIILFSFFLISCDTPIDHKGISVSSLITKQPNDSIGRIYARMMHNGSTDSAISLCTPCYRQAVQMKDFQSIVYHGLNLSQIYLIQEMPDSVRYYFSEVSRYPITGQNAVYYNHLHGVYALTYDSDYEQALDYFTKAYHHARKLKDWKHTVSELGNIIYLFYIQEDPDGLEYAEKAIAISEKYRCSSHYTDVLLKISLSSMLLLNDDPKRALDITRDIEDEIGTYNLDFIFNILRGDIYSYLEDDMNAEFFYRKAVSEISGNSPESKSRVFLRYGDLLKNRQENQLAVQMYMEGLEICQISGDMLHFKDLLYQLSDTYDAMGCRDSSERYRSLYFDSMDRLGADQSQIRFYKRLRSFQKLEQDLELMTFRKTLVTAISLGVILLLIVLFLLILFFRQRRMYQILVLQHQRSLLAQKLSQMEEPAMDKTEYLLFEKMETLMKVDKFYRRKDLTLEKLAEELGSNRSYVSRAINTFAKMKFTSYIDSYRIQEAIMLISEEEKQISFKEMADYLGYNSVSVFYRAFQREIGCPPGRYRDEVRRIRQSEIDDE